MEGSVGGRVVPGDSEGSSVGDACATARPLRGTCTARYTAGEGVLSGVTACILGGVVSWACYGRHRRIGVLPIFFRNPG